MTGLMDGWDEDCECEPPDFGSQEYWEAHFASAPRGASTDPKALEFEWLCGDWKILLPLLTPHLPKEGCILHPGCGMSVLPILLQREASLEVLSLDSSPSCIKLMQQRNYGGDGSNLRWRVWDVTRLEELQMDDLSAVVEKGCLDALLCCSDVEAAKYVAGVARLLHPGAPFLVVSNSSARQRHLQNFFEVQHVVPVDPQDKLFGPCVYVCRRREDV